MLIYPSQRQVPDGGGGGMKWMVILGLAAAVIGGLFRWRFAPSDPEKWGLVDVGMAVIGIGGAVFFVLGVILLGLKEVFR
jgi:hypothetical protein